MHGYLFGGEMLPYMALLRTARLLISGNAAYTFFIWITFYNIMYIFMQAYLFFSVVI